MFVRTGPLYTHPDARSHTPIYRAAEVPTVRAVHAAGGDKLGWCDTDSDFEFTLDLLLDGLEHARRRATTCVETHRSTTPPPSAPCGLVGAKRGGFAIKAPPAR